MQPKDLIDAVRYCTHLIYGFATVDKDDHKVKPSDEDLDVKRDNYRTITDLKIHNPRLNVLLSIGGYENEDPEAYMEAVSNPFFKIHTVFLKNKVFFSFYQVVC